MRLCLEEIAGWDIVMQRHTTEKNVHPPQAFHITSCNSIQAFGLEPMSRHQPSPVNQKPPVQREWGKEQESGPDVRQPSLGF